MASSARPARAARTAALLALSGAVGFAALAVAVAVGWTEPFDRAVLEWFGRHDRPGLDRMAAAATELGAWIVVVAIAALASAVLWTRGERAPVALLAVGLAGGTLINHVLKAVFARERPDVFGWRILYAGEHAFPSGHALQAALAYTLFAWLLGFLGASRALGLAAWATAAVVILVVGATRIHLGVHFPSDVVGGILAGLAWALGCIAVFIHRVAPERAAGAE